MPVLGVWESELVWALAGKTSVAPTATIVSQMQSLMVADTRTPTPSRILNLQ